MMQALLHAAQCQRPCDLATLEIIHLVTFYLLKIQFSDVDVRSKGSLVSKRQGFTRVDIKYFFPDGIAARLVRLPHAVNVAIRV